MLKTVFRGYRYRDQPEDKMFSRDIGLRGCYPVFDLVLVSDDLIFGRDS